MGGKRFQTVAETRAFTEDIDALLSHAEREAVVTAIAADPDGGDLIPGAGGRLVSDIKAQAQKRMKR